HPVRFTYMNLGRKDIRVDHEKAQEMKPHMLTVMQLMILCINAGEGWDYWIQY
ncbi:hypothetical protein AC249_AIPGENE24339, partial [Exaiptasia diaphana]